MRLLVVTQYFWPENFRINELVAELVQRGHKVTVLTGRPNYPEGVVFADYLAQPQQFAAYAGARILRVPLAPRGSTRWALLRNYLSFVVWGCLLGPWRLRGQRFDAIFVYEISPITVALPALLLGWIKRAPVLLWVLDLWPETLSAIGVVRSKRLLNAVGRLAGFIYRRCDTILTQSQAFVPSVRRWAGDQARVGYFPGWGEGVFDDVDAAAPAPEVHVRPDCFRIVFAGNLGEAQDFPAILDAAQQLRADPRIQWFIVGDGRATPAIKARIEALDLQDCVHLLGRFPLERMPSFFRAADALLVSLRADATFALTIPGKVQSYLSAGVPMLGMLDGEGARVLRESGAGLVGPAGDAAALAAHVRQLASMPLAQRQSMGKLGAAYGKATFGRKQLLDSLDTWLEQARMRKQSPSAKG